MVTTLPPATIFLLTYNQEHLVRDAVRSVLAQDYPALQVILSDDRSSDATFAMIEEEAAAYRGPHELIVRQPARNLGLVRHFYNVAELATGSLLVCAEGDDISYPHRVRKLVNKWIETRADALVSNWDVIDEAGHIIQRGRTEGQSDLRTDKYFPGQSITMLTGASSAYSAETLRRVPPPSEPVWAEDLYVTLILAWRGRHIHYVDEPLIAYRKHDGSLSHFDTARGTTYEQERETAQWSQRMVTQLRQVDQLITKGAPSLNRWGTAVEVDYQAIREDISFNLFRSTWLKSRLRDRLQAYLQFSDPSHRRWLAPRLFGTNGVALLRQIRTFGRQLRPRQFVNQDGANARMGSD